MPPGLPSDTPLDAVEARVAELLRADKRALKLAAELPVIWRIPVTVTEAIFFSFKHRWAARWTTRLYVETHVRRQLEALRACLRLEFLGTTAPEDRDRIAALEEELARRVQPLLGWRRLLGLAARLPAIAATVPVVWAASILPQGGPTFGSASDALLVLALTALGVWVLVVWPAVKLGFRAKRAIFAGGCDLNHPFFEQPGEVCWGAFAARQREGDDGCDSAKDVYATEKAVFDALGRRRPAEIPLDLLLSFVPYIWFALFGVTAVAIVDVILTGFEGLDLEWDNLAGLPVLLMFIVFPFVFVGNAIRNYRSRPH